MRVDRVRSRRRTCSRTAFLRTAAGSRFIAVESSDAGVSTIFVMPASGGRWTPMTEGMAYDDKPHWGPDGQHALFRVEPRRVVQRVGPPLRRDVRDARAARPFRVTSFSSPRQTISPQLSRMQIAVTARHLFLPITETLWRALDAGERGSVDRQVCLGRGLKTASTLDLTIIRMSDKPPAQPSRCSCPRSSRIPSRVRIAI